VVESDLKELDSELFVGCLSSELLDDVVVMLSGVVV
jgi:hypothetical protein